MSAALYSLTLKRSARRTFELRVYPDGRVEARVPQWASERAIAEFIEEREGWLTKQLQKANTQPTAPAAASWQCRDGAEVRFLGETLTLRLSEGTTAAWGEGAHLCLQLPQADPRRYEELLLGWYRQRAEHIFTHLIDYHFPHFEERGLARPQLRIKRMTSRWGSLSARGYINLNLALVQFDPASVEFVVVHELCHLVHMNHGKRFKALQEKLLPDWQARSRKLEQQAREKPSLFSR